VGRRRVFDTSMVTKEGREALARVALAVFCLPFVQLSYTSQCRVLYEILIPMQELAHFLNGFHLPNNRQKYL
jgi:pyridoxal/pyridoxine/pyridoxamine kinase